MSLQPHRIAPPLLLNRTIFYMGLLFLFAGLISALFQDVAVGQPLVLASDVLALVVFIICLALTWFGKINYGTALLICVGQTCFNFIFGFILISNYTNGGSAVNITTSNPQIILVFYLFSAVAGIAINRWAAIVLGVTTIGVECWFAVAFSDRQFYASNLLLNITMLAGSIVIVFYYRRILENIAGSLDQKMHNAKLLKEKAEELHELNKPFVSFGKNTASLVNDFQNDIVVIRSELDLLRQTNDTNLTGISLTHIEDAIKSLNLRIEWVKYVASATVERSEELIDVARLVESAVYPFSILPDYRERVQFVCNIDSNIRLRGFRRWLLQVVENIIRNCCEAHATHIRIEAIWDGHETISLLFDDDGPGIPWCSTCTEMDCMSCKAFRSNRSTKSHGTGYGMINVIRAVEQLGGGLHVDSGRPGAGTRIRVSLPNALMVVVEPEVNITDLNLGNM